MTKFDIRSPGIADRYPMRILWVEDRTDQVVREGDVVAVYATPKDPQRRITAPFTGKVTKVFVTSGTMLAGPTALVEVSRIEEASASAGDAGKESDSLHVEPGEPAAEEPEDAARAKAGPAAAAPEPHPRSLRRMLDASVIDAIFDRVLGPKGRPAAPVPATAARRWRLTRGEALLFVLMAAAGAAVYVWKERPDLLAFLDGLPHVYDGSLSRQAAMARQIDESLLTEVRDMAPFGVGQGTLEIYRTPEAAEYIYCPAVAVGPTMVAFAETCGRSVLDAAPGGIAPTIYFRARRVRGEAVESLVYPVTEIHRWLSETDTGMAALAVVAPTDGGSLSDDTGHSGFALVDLETPPPYLRLDTAPASPGILLASRGCRYYSETAPQTDRSNGLHAFTARLETCALGKGSGYIRLPVEGRFYFGGFYTSDRDATEASSEDGQEQVWPQLFGARDGERLAAARNGEIPPGSGMVRASGLPYPSGLYLANACDRPTIFHFMVPGSGTMQQLEVAGNSETRVSNAPFTGVFLYSIGTGTPADADSQAVDYGGRTYHMRRADAVRGDVILRNPPC